jgi:SAM-dependent methyltransferase
MIATLDRCVVCGDALAAVVWRENGYDGRTCACGTVSTTPPPPPGAVDPTADGHAESYYAAPARRRLRWLGRHRARGRLLEIGCGEGYFLAAAQAAGYDVAGIEPDPGRARRAAARLGAPVECALLETAAPGAARFDIVYHCDLLSHFDDPIAALRRMTAFLAPGGVLAFEAGLLGGVAPWWYAVIGRVGYPQHRWLFSERSLGMLLARAGLELVHATRFGLGPGTLFRGAVRALPAGHRLADRTQSFWRYTAGRLAPRLGPATVFAIASPRKENEA